MVNTEVGKEDDVFQAIFDLEEVKEIFMVYGVHDLIVVIEANDMDRLRNLITQKIRKIDGVKSTLTSIVIKKQSKK